MPSITLDPFTVMAEQGYQVGSRAKSKPPVGTPLWGTVVHNDGQTLRVKWDWLDEIHEYDLVDEIRRHHESVTAFEAALGPPKDPIEAALGSFGGSSNPGHTSQEERPQRWEMRDEWCANYKASRG